MLEKLPDELFVALAGWLDCPTLCSLSSVCRSLQSAIDEACWRALCTGLGWLEESSAADAGLYPRPPLAKGANAQETLKHAIEAQRSAMGHYDHCRTWQSLAQRRYESERRRCRGDLEMRIVQQVWPGHDEGVWRIKVNCDKRSVVSTGAQEGILRIGRPMGSPDWRADRFCSIDVPPYTHLELSNNTIVVMDYENFVAIDATPSSKWPAIEAAIRLPMLLPDNAQCHAYKVRYPLLVTVCLSGQCIYVFDIRNGKLETTIPLAQTTNEISYIELDEKHVFLLSKRDISVYDRESARLIIQWRSQLPVGSSRWHGLHHHNGDLVAMHFNGLLFIRGYEDVLAGQASLRSRALELEINSSHLAELSVENGRACWSDLVIHDVPSEHRHPEPFTQRIWSIDLAQLEQARQKSPTIQLVCSFVPIQRPISRLEQDSTAIYFPADSQMVRAYMEEGTSYHACKVLLDRLCRQEVASWRWYDGQGRALQAEASQSFKWDDQDLRTIFGFFESRGLEHRPAPDAVACIDTLSMTLSLDSSDAMTS